MDNLKNNRKQQKECINVSVRIRPTLKKEDCGLCLQIISIEPPVLLVLEKSQTFHFGNIFSEEDNQERIYNDAVKPFVDYVKTGYNCTVFAYGQTGTGKTYTMGSGSQKPTVTSDVGIIPRALEQLFCHRYFNTSQEIEISISFCEIYNEKVFDLLQPTKKTPLPVSGFVVQGLNVKKVVDVQEAKELLELGNKNRHVGETKQNMNSSRSHAIFTVYYTNKTRCEEITGKLNLVDLAGSESVRKTGSKGNTLQEGININKGLLSIGQVISALSMGSSHIPYRQSMITSILQGSLNVDNYISLIACVSSNSDDMTETLQTLDFAQRVKKVRNKPEVNQAVAKYKKENPGLFNSMRTPMKRSNSTPLKSDGVKKMVLHPLPLIDESRQSQISAADCSKNQFSIDVSTVSSRVSPRAEISQQTLSPVIRKYYTKMEESIMVRLETLIKTNLRPQTTSLGAEKFQENVKENTPSISWNKIQQEVSKLVKNEIFQMSVKTVRATSSPIEEIEKGMARRVLTYDSPDNLYSATNSDSPLETDNIFKVPKLPIPNKKKNDKSQPPTDKEIPKIIPRRSIRLLKRIDRSLNNNETLDLSEMSLEGQDVKIQDKTENGIEVEFNESCYKVTNTTKRGVLCNNSRRKSVRIAKKMEVSALDRTINEDMKKNGYKSLMTPAKRVLKKLKNNDSPYTAHSKQVLRILNEGSLQEIEKLHTVGMKTAQQIMLYKKLKGSFKNIEDLTNIPGWGPKKYEKFVSLNFLKKI